MFDEFRAVENRRKSYQQQALITPGTAAAIGKFANRQPYAKPGVALAVGKAAAKGQVDPNAVAAAIDQQQVQTYSGAGMHQKPVTGDKPTSRFTGPNALQDAAKATGEEYKPPDGGFDPFSIGDYLDKAGDVAKGVTRTGLAVAQSGAELVQTQAAQRVQGAKGVVEDIGKGDILGAYGQAQRVATGINPAHPFENLQATTAGAAIGQATKDLPIVGTGEGGLSRVDMGSGFFPAGTVAEQQAQRSREVRGTVNGSAWTLGRQYASLVFQPGTTPYNLASGLTDAAVVWYGDPANFIGHSAMEAREASKLFVAGDHAEAAADAAGTLINAERKTINGVGVNAWLTSKTGTKVLDNLAADDDFLSVKQALGNKAPVDVVHAITKAKTPEEVANILRPSLGAEIRSTSNIPAAAKTFEARQAVRRFIPGLDAAGLPNSRLFAEMPKSMLNLSSEATSADHINTVNQVDNWLKLNNVDIATRRAVVGKMGQALAVGTKADRVNALNAFADSMREGLIAHHGGLLGRDVSAELAADLTRWTKDTTVSKYGVDLMGRDTDWGHLATVSGNVDVSGIGPGLLSEGLNSKVYLPDPREFRRLTSPLAKVLSKGKEGELRSSLAGIEYLQNKVWKPLAILRPATAVRIAADEHARLAASGMVSGFHPFDAILTATGTRADIDAFGRTFDQAAASGMAQEFIDATGQSFYNASKSPDELERATRATGAWSDAGKADDPYNWKRGMEAEIGQLAADPVARRVAGGATTDDVMAWLHSPEGDASMRQIVARGSAGEAAVDATTGKRVKVPVDYTDDSNLRSLIDNYYRGRVDTKLGDNQILRDAVAHNRLPGAGATMSGGIEGFEPGMRVRAADRSNIGTVMSASETDVHVRFVSPDGGEAEVWLPRSDVTALSAGGAGDRALARSESIANKDLTFVAAGPTARDASGNYSRWVGATVKDSEGNVGVISDDLGGGRSQVQFGADAAFSGGAPTPALQRHIEEHMLSPNSPERVKYNISVDELKKKNPNLQERWDKGVNSLMSALMDTPTNTLTRSPVFREAYYQRMSELAQHLTPEDANQLLKNLSADAGKKGFLDKVSDFLGGDKRTDSVLNAAKRANGDLTLKELDEFAKGHALDTVKDILYDTSTRSNLMDTMRVIAPFAQPWKEVIENWTKIIARNPNAIRRAQIVVEGARGSGFFYTDPNTGQEVFNYPGSAWLTKSLIGTEAPLKGSVAGLNIAGNFIPSVGPVIQFPAAELTRNVPQADFIRGLLLPFGEPLADSDNSNTGGLGERILAYGLPSYAQKFISAFTTDPQSTSVFGNTYAEVLRVKAASGKYGTDPEERRRLESDAKAEAKALTVLRSLGQFFAPSAPTYQYQAETKQGDTLVGQMAKDLHKWQNEDYDTAISKFLDTYGEGAYVYLQSKTKSANGGLDASSAFGDWERSHQNLFDSYPAVASYFADTGDDFNFEVYNRQLASGKRTKLSDEDMLNAADTTLARWKLGQLRAKLPDKPNKAQKEWLAAWKTKLQKQYPGFAVAPAYNPAEFQTNIEELRRASKDSNLSNNDVADGVTEYFKYRDAALAEAQKRGFKSLASDKTADLRAWLVSKAAKVTSAHPNFGRLYDRVLSTEVED